MQIVGSCCFLQVLFMTFSAIFRSNQMMRIGMIVSITVNIAKRAALSSTLVTTLCSFVICLFIQPVLGLFNATPAVKALCQKVMYIEILLQFGRSFNMLYIRALQGAGDIRYPVAIGILDNWITVVGLGYVFGCMLHWGLPGVWLAMALDENIRGLIFIFRWRGGEWKQKVLA